jgi:hypothetical protein
MTTDSSKVSAWLASLRGSIARQRYRLQGALIARLPPAAIEPLAAATWRATRFFDAHARMRGAERCEIVRHVFAREPLDTRHVAAAGLRERLIDQRIYFGRLLRGGEAWPDLQAVAAVLARRIRQLQTDSPGRPVFVSPFHYVSQYANIYVVDELRAQLNLQSIAVVSGVPPKATTIATGSACVSHGR